MKIGDEVYVHGYVDEIRNGTIIIRNEGGYFGTAPDEVMPSAQPEIIRCRDCKYAEVADPEDSQDGYSCQFHRGSIWFSGSYCSWAERREG